MRVIITGGSGLIGRSLVQALAPIGHEIIVLSRDPAQTAQVFGRDGLASVRTVGWDARTDDGWGELVTRESAIVNLAGASPAHWRWTPSYRARILESRLGACRAVMRVIERYGPPTVLVQASASGYYGDRGQELLTEASRPGHGFRALVCEQWETATAQAHARRCVIRTGLVLDTHAGALPPLLRFAQLLGSRLGDGRQWVPWAHKEDVASAIRFLLERPALHGPFNLCAPQAVTNRQFIHTLQHILGRFPLFPLPAIALRAALGELSSVMLDSQRLVPQRLVQEGFPFAYPELVQALCHLLAAKGLSR
jgi:uncharacterized protein (TIGR01777 family)